MDEWSGVDACWVLARQMCTDSFPLVIQIDSFSFHFLNEGLIQEVHTKNSHKATTVALVVVLISKI